jgi:hypothetical protein
MAALMGAALIWTASIWPTAAVAQGATVGVEARLSAKEVTAGTPVELSLTATSSGGELSPPDVTPLEGDFQILDRRVERQMSTVNGERRERLRLRLLLLPLRPGTLQVPPINFGTAVSQPLTLSVDVDPEGGEVQVPTSDPAPPWLPPPNLWSGPPAWSDPLASPPPQGLAWPEPQLAPPAPPPVTSETKSPTAPPEGSNLVARTLRDPWFWATLALAAGLWWSLRRGRVAVVSAASADHAQAQVPETLPNPLGDELDRMRSAYASGNARAARESLLAWGRLRWPQDPPGNLARLAQRCPENLAVAIQQLEKAFFSPTPIPWQDAAVADCIAGLDPPIEAPARETEDVV